MYFTDRGIEELAARRGEEDVSLAWLAERLDEPELVVLHVLHARQAAQFDSAHVPGARLLRYDRIAGEVDGLAAGKHVHASDSHVLTVLVSLQRLIRGVQLESR